MDASAGVTQEFFSTFLQRCLPRFFTARRIQPSVCLVDLDVEFCVPDIIVLHLMANKKNLNPEHLASSPRQAEKLSKRLGGIIGLQNSSQETQSPADTPSFYILRWLNSQAGCFIANMSSSSLVVCVCVFIKLHMTAQSGPVIYSFYATACNPPGGYLSKTYSWLEMRVRTATTPLPATTALGRNRKAGFSPLVATDRDGNPTNREHHGQLSL